MWSEALVVACSVCFGAANSPMLDAARLGVLVMAVVTCGVLTLFARFFVRLARNGDCPRFPEAPAAGNGDSHRFRLVPATHENGDSHRSLPRDPENGDSHRFLGGG